MTTTENRPWIRQWPVLTLLSGVLVVGSYEFMSAFEIAQIGAEGDIGGGMIFLLGLLLIFTGGTATLAARPRRHPSDAAAETPQRWIPVTWPARMLTLGMVMIVGSTVMMGFDLGGYDWISAVGYMLGVFVSVAGGGAMLAYHRSSRPSR